MVSGAAQVAIVGLLASGPAPVLLATIGLALRHIPMSAALSSLLGQAPTHHRIRLAWVLVDETFGLTVNAARDPSVDLVSFKSGRRPRALHNLARDRRAVGAFLGADVDTSRLGIEVVFPARVSRIGRAFRSAAAATGSRPASRWRLRWQPSSCFPPEWRVTAAAIVAAVIGSRIK